MANDWFYASQGKQQGPVSLDALRQMRAAGTVASTDMVWHHGMSGWVRAGEVPELATGEQPSAAVPAPAPAGAPSASPATLSYGTFPASGEVTLGHRGFDLLKQTRPWVRMMSIVCWVFAGFALLGGVAIMLAGVMSSRGGVPPLLGLVYIAMAFLYIAPAIYLHRYAGRITDLLAQRREMDLQAALQAQKSFWKFCGVTTLVVIALYAVGIVIAMLIAVLR